MNDIIFTSIRLNELEILIENSVTKVLKQCSMLQNNEPQKIDSDILDIKEASELLNLAIPTIYGLVSKRAYLIQKVQKTVLQEIRAYAVDPIRKKKFSI